MISDEIITNQEVQREISVTEGVAEGQKDFFDKMQTLGKLDIGLVKQHGVACLDVEYGSEILAFSQYSPKVIFASEPVNDVSRETLIAVVLAEIIKKNPTNLIRGHSLEALEKIKAQLGKEKLGLITYLNIYDDGLVDEELLVGIINQAQELLVKQGSLIMSFIEEGSSRIDLFTRLSQRFVSGMKLTFDDDERMKSSAGSLFLFAKKIGQ